MKLKYKAYIIYYFNKKQRDFIHHAFTIVIKSIENNTILIKTNHLAQQHINIVNNVSKVDLPSFVDIGKKYIKDENLQ